MIDTYLLQAARKAHRSGDYHSARGMYQQIAYSYNDFTELEKDAFTKEVADFAGDDPIYQEVLKIVVDYIKQENTPVLQSKLTNVIKENYGEKGAELLRYVLYYADHRDELKRVKKGRSYELSLPKKSTKEENIFQQSKLLSQQIYFDGKISYKPSQEDLNSIQYVNDYYELQRKATDFKNNNWELSLACLYKAKLGLENTAMHASPQEMLRLPLFLQQAGKFEEAKSELQLLLNNTEKYVQIDAKGFEPYELYKKRATAHYLSYLFDKARLIYKREKLLNKSEEFRLLSVKFSDELKQINQEIGKQREIEFGRYNQEKAEFKLKQESNNIPSKRFFKNKQDIKVFLLD